MSQRRASLQAIKLRREMSFGQKNLAVEEVKKLITTKNKKRRMLSHSSDTCIRSSYKGIYFLPSTSKIIFKLAEINKGKFLLLLKGESFL